MQRNAVVEATVIPSLPKREPVIDLAEEVDKRKNRFNGGGFGNPKRRSDSFETRGILRSPGDWEAPPSDDSLETRGGTRGGGGGNTWVGRRSDNLEIREHANEDKDLVDEVDVDASEELSSDLEDRGTTRHSGNGKRVLQRGGVGGSKRGLRGTGGADGHKRGLQRPGKGGGGKRGLTPGSGGSK